MAIVTLWLGFYTVFSYAEPIVSKRNVELSWEKIKGAKAYEIRFDHYINGEFKKSNLLFRTKETKWKNELATGRYQFRLRAIDRRGVAGKWSPPSEIKLLIKPIRVIIPENNVIIKSNKADKKSVKIAWQGYDKASHYIVKIFDSNKKLIDDFETQKEFKSIELDVAKTYYFNVQAVSLDDDLGEPLASLHKFTLKGRPLSQPIIENENNLAIDKIEWEKPPFAEKYRIYLYKKTTGKTKKWKAITKNRNHRDHYFSLKGIPLGDYKIKIIAEAPLRYPSKKLTYYFKHVAIIYNKFKEKHDYRTSISYAYKPYLQTFDMQLQQLQTSFNSLVLDSYALNAEYWFTQINTSLSLNIDLKNTTLFDNLESQNPIEINYEDFTLLAKYRFSKELFSLDLLAGYASDTVYSFNNTVVTIHETKNRLNRILLGGNINLPLFSWKFYATALTSLPLSMKPLEIKGLSKSTLRFGSSSYIFDKTWEMDYFIENTSAKYTYSNSLNTSLDSTTELTNTFGASIRYFLDF